jgi:hypothetical protein
MTKYYIQFVKITTIMTLQYVQQEVAGRNTVFVITGIPVPYRIGDQDYSTGAGNWYRYAKIAHQYCTGT